MAVSTNFDAGTSASSVQVFLPVDGDFLRDAAYTRVNAGLLLTGADGSEFNVPNFFNQSAPLVAADGLVIPFDLAKVLAEGAGHNVFAQAGGAGVTTAADIGQIKEIYGGASLVRNGQTLPVTAGTALHMGDQLLTTTDGRIAVVMADGSTFVLEKNGRMVLDDFIYNPEDKSGHSLTSILRGTFVFVSGQIAKTDHSNMMVRTPTATIGVRGTGVGGEANEGNADSSFLLLDGAISLTKPDGTSVLLDTVGERVSTNPLSPFSSVTLIDATQLQQTYGTLITIVNHYVPANWQIPFNSPTQDHVPGDNDNGRPKSAPTDNHGFQDGNAPPHGVLPTADHLNGGFYPQQWNEGAIFGPRQSQTTDIVQTPQGPVPFSVTGLTSGTDTGFSAHDGITKNNAPIIEGVGAPAGAVITILDSLSVIGTATADASGHWLYDPAANNQIFGPGLHTFSAQIRDGSGTIIQTSVNAFDVTVDLATANIVPSLATASDTGTIGDNVTANTRPTFQGAAESGAHINVYDGDPNAGGVLIATAIAGANGAWTATYSAALQLTFALHHIYATETDVAGNVSVAATGYDLNVQPIISLVFNPPTGAAGGDVASGNHITVHDLGVGDQAATIYLDAGELFNFQDVALKGSIQVVGDNLDTVILGNAGGLDIGTWASDLAHLSSIQDQSTGVTFNVVEFYAADGHIGAIEIQQGIHIVFSDPGEGTKNSDQFVVSVDTSDKSASVDLHDLLPSGGDIVLPSAGSESLAASGPASAVDAAPIDQHILPPNVPILSAGQDDQHLAATH